jgi:hypothetical protein
VRGSALEGHQVGQPVQPLPSSQQLYDAAQQVGRGLGVGQGAVAGIGLHL